MSSNDRNNPPKPNKDQKVTDLPTKNTKKDAQVKGGRGIEKPFAQDEM